MPNNEELQVTLETSKITLDASIETGIIVKTGVKDVQVDGNSVVNPETHIANIELGEGLEYAEGKLVVQGSTADALIEINSLSGQFTVEEISAIAYQARIKFGTMVYYLAQHNGDQIVYRSQELTEYDRIDINTTSRMYVVQRHEPNVYDQHLANGTIHITDEERQFWNDKVSCSSPEGTDLIVFTTD